MQIDIFLYLALLYGSAYVIKIIMNKLKIPEVTGYVILGVILGSTMLMPAGILDRLEGLSTIALGMIAFLIGIEFRFDVLRRLGKSIILIVLFEGFVTFGVVFAVLYALAGVSLNLSLMLAAVSSATAPAATVAVIRQYKAKGPLTSTILAVVGIDDAFAIILYVFIENYVTASLLGTDIRFLSTIGAAALSVLLSIAIGAAIAGLFCIVLRKVRNNEWILVLLAASLFLVLGLADLLGMSELLSMMTFGIVVANASDVLAKKSESIIAGFMPIFLAAFFILGGAHLDITLLRSIGLIGILYFVSRTVGKISGATLGAVLGRAPKSIRNNIGFSLLPQVGVALALALAIDKRFTQPQFGDAGNTLAVTIINILLFTTILTEIIGPLLTKAALGRTGELHKTE